MGESLDEWLQRRAQIEQDYAAKERAEWLAGHPDADPPELVFPPPPCPICGLGLNCDDGWVCLGCNAVWSHDGRGGMFLECERDGPPTDMVWSANLRTLRPRCCAKRAHHKGRCGDINGEWAAEEAGNG